MILSERTRQDLGLSEIFSALSSRCRTPLGAERAEHRPLLEDASAVSEALAKVEEARTLFEQAFSLPLSGVTDLRVALDRAQKGGILEPRELLLIAQALSSFARTRDALEERESLVPALAVVARGLPGLGHLADRIEGCFTSNGELADHASPELRESRDRVRALHRRIKERLDGLLHDERFAKNLRENYFSVRNDRYVVPVRAQERAAVPGIVHNASQSGQTLFVEPEAMIGLGNDLAIAQSLVVEEERRILQDLTDAVGREVGAISGGLSAAAELDELEAAARLAADLGAHTPQMELADGRMTLLSLRHPLLVLRGKAVVANDVRLGGDTHALVVSGPNAGGKTVTLTAVGLCALMVRAGLPIPVGEGSTLPLFKAVHSTVGDAQDIHRDLSTFSAHLLQLREIGSTLQRGALVLIDEIAADTDPREGAALAIAVLEDFLDRGASVLVTTHLEELKALAHMDARFQNARVGFDPVKMQPTFKLTLGVAGASSALEIAERMGLPSRLVQRARDLAQSSGGPLSKALQAAEEERQKLAQELMRALEVTAQLAAEREALQKERSEWEAKKAETEGDFHAQLAAEAELAAHELRQRVSELRSKGNLGEIEQARREIATQLETERARARELAAQKAKAEEGGPPSLSVGSWVFHNGLGRDVEIVELVGSDALVLAGAMKVRVKATELSRAKSRRPRTQAPSSVQSRKGEVLRKAEETSAKPLSLSQARCDVRGMRGDEAIREVEGVMDESLRRGEETVLIVHGHGTGALKQQIREYLDRSPYVRMFRPGESHEGGDGVTVAALRS